MELRSQLLTVFFQDVCKAIVQCLYDKFVYLPRNIDEWSQELKNFLENWEFPCVGAWDGFHVYISTKLKNFYSFKKRYSVTNMGFIGQNKRFMWAAVGAAGSTHDSRLLKNCNIYSDINNGLVFPNNSLSLSSYGEIPIATVGDSAFPSSPWLLKPYNEGIRVPKQMYFNKRLCSARVVSEHAYGMLKGRWRILYKKTECHLDNISLLLWLALLFIIYASTDVIDVNQDGGLTFKNLILFGMAVLQMQMQTHQRKLLQIGCGISNRKEMVLHKLTWYLCFNSMVKTKLSLYYYIAFTICNYHIDTF